MSFAATRAHAMHTTFVVHSVVSRDARVRLSRSSARIRPARALNGMTSTDSMSTPTRARRVVRARASEDKAQDSSAYRSGAENPELDGVLGKLVSNLPDGRRESAPESYDARPESKTLKEGRYARGDPIRAGGVREDTLRGEDFTVVEGEGPSVTTLATLAVGAAVLFGVYKVVELLGDEPVEKRRSSSRTRATDTTIVAETASAGESAMESSTMPTEAESLRAPAPALEE